MKNNYGNYVVQKALKISTGSIKNKLIISILKNIEKIGDKKLIGKWKNIVINCLPPENEMTSPDGDLILKLLKSIQFEENIPGNKSNWAMNCNQNFNNQTNQSKITNLNFFR